MRVNIFIDNADYGKFSDLELCYIDNGVNRKVPLSFLGYERVFDFTADFTSVKFDFFLVSAIVYGVDNLLSRAIYSNDGWTRDIEVEFPVNNLAVWSGKEEKLKQILDFLTGDNWLVSFRKIENVDLFQPRTNRRKIPSYDKDSIKSVSLFSGGLDSLIGVIDELEKLSNNERMLLVSHFDSKSPGPNRDQKILLKLLEKEYPNKIYWVQSKLSLSRKDINGNLPANYTYAYKMLSGSATSEEKSHYASKLNERYLKYGNQEPIASFLMLFNNYLEMGEKITKIRAAYVQDNQAAKNLANKYVSQIKTSEISYAKERLDYFTTYYSKYIDYLDQVKNAGCIKGDSIDVNCEVNNRINPDNEALNDLYTELDGLETTFSDSYLDSTLYLNDSIIAFYNTKSTTKEK